MDLTSFTEVNSKRMVGPNFSTIFQGLLNHMVINLSLTEMWKKAFSYPVCVDLLMHNGMDLGESPQLGGERPSGTLSMIM